MIRLLIEGIEKGLVPDFLVRQGIRALSHERLKSLSTGDVEARQAQLKRHIERLAASEVAENTREANEQHYELPPEFFTLCLGARRKYSACYWPEGTGNLDEAEVASLTQVCERLRLKDGLEVLELGCGWGSLTLWMAEHYPNARITAVSNSAPQRSFILGECEKRGYRNVNVVTADINAFSPGKQFDRVVSIEMMEHVRNYASLMSRISDWMKPGAFFFSHIFVHKDLPYLFETEGDDNWMGRYFFTGGQMPSRDLLLYYQRGLEIEDHWVLNGRHYAHTSNAWLANMDAKKAQIMPILEKTYGADATRWWNRWRVFYMAVAELFDYAGGEEWIVAHHLFRKPISE
jgi:cyclopropane-fatty-acyl-phospholipid synthase